MILSHMILSIPLAAAFVPAATDPVGTLIQTLATDIQGDAVAVGLTVFIISVVIAGVMRMVAFGSERRIALSNMALTAAVVGLIIMGLATTLQTFLQGIFPTP